MNWFMFSMVDYTFLMGKVTGSSSMLNFQTYKNKHY